MRSAVWGAGLVLLTCSATALAEGANEDAERAVARAAGYAGIRAYEDGDYKGAVDKLGRAFGVVKVPTLGLWYARALIKTGKLVEASERYGEVMRLDVTEGKVKEQKKAQADAATELDALHPRIPTLTILVQNATKDCEVSLDGSPMSNKVLGLATPANPGNHRIQAKQDGRVVEQSVTLVEGEKKTLELQLEPVLGADATPAPTVSGEAAQSTMRSADTSAAQTSIDTRGKTQRTIGWITLGLGGAATAAGVVTGVLGISKRSQLDDNVNCSGTNCLRSEHDQVASYNQLRTISTVGFVVGAVGVAAGTTLLLTAPRPKREPEVVAWLGIGSVGLRGAF